MKTIQFLYLYFNFTLFSFERGRNVRLASHSRVGRARVRVALIDRAYDSPPSSPHLPFFLSFFYDPRAIVKQRSRKNSWKYTFSNSGTKKKENRPEIVRISCPLKNRLTSLYRLDESNREIPCRAIFNIVQYRYVRYNVPLMEKNLSSGSRYT